MNAWIEFESGARCSLLLTFMDALARPEDGGVGSRPTFGMAPGGGSTGGCRVDFEHGTYLPRHLRSHRAFAARKPPRQSSLRCLPTTAAPAASVWWELLGC